LGSSKVILSSGASYNTTLSSFWSGQSRDDDPSCIVQPESSVDVSAAVQILTSKWCKFSVKSGGHMPWAGAASINGGIEIDLVNLSAVTLSSSNATAFLGPGARWGKVYDTLTPLGYGVAGGRDSTVGVGGLILGGRM
jgi:FAD/FMN-containing dehydrogenase